MALSRELTGRVAVVTGASSGIGLAAVRRLAAAGARIVLVARDQTRLNAVAADVAGDCVSCACDIAADDAGARIAASLELLETDRPDIVVHAAGAFELASVIDTTVEAFDRALAVNLRAAFLLMREFVPLMLERGRGDFVTIGSVAGRQAFPANGAYSAAKFGVRGLHAVLAAELRGTGVRATLVEPAATDTPLWDEIDRRRHTDLPPKEAMMSPDAVADAVFFAVTRPDGVTVPNILVERS
jgi:NAD(P)-dependent dehydrogenase (short-subunit alcohol dehydrogenase family)